ncbi:MAG: zf-TFIIB domain-containing protein [Patescibacteria group bacterium]|nr:zf-TFIIB domain-containing protein [Patescibacteria group bacterium]
MNCTNCGAPTEWAEGRGYCYCRFCSTFQFLDGDSQNSADGATPLGQETDACCPVCGEGLQWAVVEECRVHYCPACRGMLVDGQTFGTVVQVRRARFQQPDRAAVPLNPDDLERVIDCPLCGLPMNVHPYYGPGNIVIDSCHRCHVVWLDHGELALIESAPGRR